MKTGFLAFLLLPVYAVAQTPGADTLAPVPAFFLKTNLTALLNPAKPAAAVALDVRLSRRFSADAGVGYILDAPAFADEKGESYQGLRLRAGGKYYYRFTRYGAFHIGLEAKYQEVNHWSNRNALRQGGQYLEILNTRREVRTLGLAARAGALFFSTRNRRLIVEPYIGLGWAVHRVRFSPPPDAELLEETAGFFSFEYLEGVTALPDLLFGIHLGWTVDGRRWTADGRGGRR